MGNASTPRYAGDDILPLGWIPNLTSNDARYYISNHRNVCYYSRRHSNNKGPHQGRDWSSDSSHRPDGNPKSPFPRTGTWCQARKGICGVGVSPFLERIAIDLQDRHVIANLVPVVEGESRAFEAGEAIVRRQAPTLALPA
jgi:hypothetical protein